MILVVVGDRGSDEWRFNGNFRILKGKGECEEKNGYFK